MNGKSSVARKKRNYRKRKREFKKQERQEKRPQKKLRKIRLVMVCRVECPVVCPEEWIWEAWVQ